MRNSRGFRVSIKEVAPEDLFNLLKHWDLIDIVDMQLKGAEIIIEFRTPTSAHICCKLPNLKCENIDPIPETARVPNVYVQHLPSRVTESDIIAYFQNLAPVLTVKRTPRSDAFLLKFSSPRMAIKAAESSNRQQFRGSTIIASCQFKQTVTNCFFVSTLVPGLLTIDLVRSFIDDLGTIVTIFVNRTGSSQEIFVSMSSETEAKLACGLTNKLMYLDNELSAVFVDPSYFAALYSANCE